MGGGVLRPLSIFPFCTSLNSIISAVTFSAFGSYGLRPLTPRINPIQHRSRSLPPFREGFSRNLGSDDAHSHRRGNFVAHPLRSSAPGPRPGLEGATENKAKGRAAGRLPRPARVRAFGRMRQTGASGQTNAALRTPRALGKGSRPAARVASQGDTTRAPLLLSDLFP